ncbi:MAG TPA: T9SS type A sorting domain-containing protein [bacterium]
MKQTVIIAAALLIGGIAGWANAQSNDDKARISNLPLNDGANFVPAKVGEVSAEIPRWTDETDVVGDTVSLGTTWYELQHNGTIGRMVVLDDSGRLHFVWTNGLNSSSSVRHVYYNRIDPPGFQAYPGVGIQVDTSIKAGFTCLAVDDNGVPLPAFHHQTGLSPNPHSAAAAVSYGTFELPWYQGQDLPFIWPRICRKMDGEFLIISTQSMASNTDPMLQTWCTGTFESGAIIYNSQTLLDYTMTVAAEVTASGISNRVAAAWTSCRDEGFPFSNGSQYNNDIHMMIDDDGMNLNFDNWFNLTNFLHPDTSFYPDTLLANGDTLRAYTDISLYFDRNDYCHVAFTTLGFYQLDSLQTISASLIWHWSEERPNEFKMIANGWIHGPQPGMWNRYAQRPSLGEDPMTGYLYCTYQIFDSSTISAGGYPSGEVCVSVSTDGGQNWSVGRNITNTISPNGAAPGECYSEICPSLAERVDGDCHVLYILDYDAGNSQQANQPEGVATLNSVIYHRVPVDSIPMAPLAPQYPDPGGIPFHVQHMPDTTGYRGNPPQAPLRFALEQNTPNPFNPTTAIRFSLENLGSVTLAVYNLRGERVATLANEVYKAGTHTIGFDGADLASGIYIYRLEADGRTMARKMVLLK